MRRTFAVLILGMVGLTASINAQTVTKERHITPFTSISSTMGIEVRVLNGETSTLLVEADEVLQPYVITEVKDGKLEVRFNNTSSLKRKNTSAKVYVAINDLSSIEAHTAGTIKTEKALKVRKLKMISSTAGNIDIDIEADSLQINCTTGSDVRLRGKANFASINVSDGGTVNAKTLKVTQAEVRSATGADLNIHAEEKIVITGASGGNINYYGDPKSVVINTSTGASVNKKK